MNTVLLQKILISVVTLNTFYLVYIFALLFDLRRHINRSLFQLLPGALMFGIGMVISYVLSDPKLVFQYIFPIKSGFIKGALGTIHLPLIAASVRTMSVVTCLTAFIDKFWFFWRRKRIIFLFRMLIIIGLTIITGNTLFNIIMMDQKQLCKQIIVMNKIEFWSSITLGSILLIIVILATPTFFRQDKVGDKP